MTISSKVSSKVEEFRLNVKFKSRGVVWSLKTEDAITAMLVGMGWSKLPTASVNVSFLSAINVSDLLVANSVCSLIELASSSLSVILMMSEFPFKIDPPDNCTD